MQRNWVHKTKKNKTKTQHTICVGHYYTQTNTHNATVQISSFVNIVPLLTLFCNALYEHIIVVGKHILAWYIHSSKRISRVDRRGTPKLITVWPDGFLFR